MHVPSVKDVPVLMNPRFVLTFGTLLVAPAGSRINLFKTADCSMRGVDRRRLKTGVPSHVWQPFCRHLEERLLMDQMSARAVGRKKERIHT